MRSLMTNQWVMYVKIEHYTDSTEFICWLDGFSVFVLVAVVSSRT